MGLCNTSPSVGILKGGACHARVAGLKEGPHREDAQERGHTEGMHQRAEWAREAMEGLA